MANVLRENVDLVAHQSSILAQMIAEDLIEECAKQLHSELDSYDSSQKKQRDDFVVKRINQAVVILQEKHKALEEKLSHACQLDAKIEEKREESLSLPLSAILHMAESTPSAMLSEKPHTKLQPSQQMIETTNIILQEKYPVQVDVPSSQLVRINAYAKEYSKHTEIKRLLLSNTGMTLVDLTESAAEILLDEIFQDMSIDLLCICDSVTERVLEEI